MQGHVARAARFENESHALAAGSSNSVFTPQVPSRTLITRVPGLRPARTSETSIPARTSRARAASISATRQLNPHNRSRDRVAISARPLHQFDDQVATAKEHQPAPIRMRSVERHIEAEPRTIQRRGALGIFGRDDDMIEPRHRRVSRCGRMRTFGGQFEEEHPHAARLAGCRARALPAQGRAGAEIAALGLRDHLRLQRQPIQPAMHHRDVADAEADTGKALARLPQQFANMVRRRRIARRRHQLERHVVEGKQHGLRTVALAAPGGTAPQQDLVGIGAGHEIFDQHHEVIETANRRNTPRGAAGNIHVFLPWPGKPKNGHDPKKAEPVFRFSAGQYLSQAITEARSANNFSE